MNHPHIKQGQPFAGVIAVLGMLFLLGYVAHLLDYPQPLNPSQKNSRPVLVPIPDPYSDAPADAEKAGE